MNSNKTNINSRSKMSTKSISKPSQKQVVTSLMPFLGSEPRQLKTNKTEHSITKQYLRYKCPKPGCRNPIVRFLNKTGFNNPYSHLKRCFGKGQSAYDQEETLISLYENAVSAATITGKSIEYHFTQCHYSEFAKGVHAYIRLIIFKNLPLYFVSDEEIRCFSKYNIKIGKPRLVAIILKLTELVEEKISQELNQTKGAIMFDGWTCNDMHYVAVIASYCIPASYQEFGNKDSQNKCQLTLLGMSPMGNISTKEDGKSSSNDEATSFNAECHVEFFRQVFKFYKQSFDDWCICFLADNCSTNLKIANITKKALIGCHSHRLNLEVNYMVDNDTQLSETINSINQVMNDAKKLKNAALLRNLTMLKPVLHNKTRWSGKLLLLERFLAIREELIEVSESCHGDLKFDHSRRLLVKVEKYVNMLKEINVVTKTLQTCKYTLRECKEDLNILTQSVVEDRDNSSSALYHCKLGTKYIGKNSKIVKQPLFESAVVKIQSNRQHQLTNAEKIAVKCLKKRAYPDNNSLPLASTNAMPRLVGIEEKLIKKRTIVSSGEEYMNCNFLLGSVAEVERLWSVAKYIFTENRRSLTPQLFEAILFLKMNERFWDLELVNEAIDNITTENTHCSAESHEA